MIKSFFFNATAALSVTLVGAAYADDWVIAGGKENGGYFKWATEVAQALSQRGETTKVQSFNGSDAITLALCKGQADFGPSQQDAAYQRQLEGCELTELWTYPNKEYLWLLVPPGSRVDELEDLDEKSIIVTDEAGSGSDFSLRQLRRIEKSEQGNNSAWSNLQIENGSLLSALGRGSSGKVAGVFFVGDLGNKNLKFYLEKGWTPVEVYDKNLDNLLYNNKPLYEGGKVSFSGKSTVWTYAISTFVYGTPLPPEKEKVFLSVMETR